MEKEDNFSWKVAVGIPLAMAGGLYLASFLGRTNTQNPVKEIEDNNALVYQEKPDLSNLTQPKQHIASLESSVNSEQFQGDNEKEEYSGQYSISTQGLNLIKKYESLRLKVYRCPAGKPTIGYGHLIKPNERYTTIMPKQADDLLRKDIKSAEDSVRKLVKVKLNQNQFDVLCSFVFNFGERNFKKSTLLKKLNNNNYIDASNELSRWVYSNGKKLNGLEKRRNEEKMLFLK